MKYFFIITGEIVWTCIWVIAAIYCILKSMIEYRKYKFGKERKRYLQLHPPKIKKVNDEMTLEDFNLLIKQKTLSEIEQDVCLN